MDEDTKELIKFFSMIGGTIGALIGWGLSFTALPTFVIGAVIGTAVVLAILTALAISEFLRRSKVALSKKDILSICMVSCFAIGAIVTVAISGTVFRIIGTLIGITVGIIVPIAKLAIPEFLGKNSAGLSKKDILVICAASSVIGAVIAVAIPDIVFRSTGALIGGSIGVVAPIAALFLVDGVNECIISPIAERFFPEENSIDLQSG